MNKGSKDKALIQHILDYCDEVEQTVSRFGNAFDSFNSDKIYRNAITMCILQIGELAGHLSGEFTAEHSGIPWRSIKAMRNIAAHAYGSISIPDVWDTINNDIPVLKEYCQRLIKQ
mgnify:CR=1 FL=1